MGLFEVFLGGVEAKLKRLDRTIEAADYDHAEECLLDLRVAISRKHSPGSEVSVRLDLAEAKLRLKYQQFDRIESPARRAFTAAKGLGNKAYFAKRRRQCSVAPFAGNARMKPSRWPNSGLSWLRLTLSSGSTC
jgi:hypothetical protein